MGRACQFSYALVLLGHSFMACLAISLTNSTDQSALLAFKSHINFKQNNDHLANNWSTTTSFCNWTGVTCSARHQRVIGLNLQNMGLSGTIPPSLGNLSFLTYLNLGRNNFHGHLPNELSHLRRLKYMNLEYNNFSGDVPIWFVMLPSLQHIILENNSFTGTIPSSLSNISKLETLSLSTNHLQGNIPEEISHLNNLKILYLDFNHLSGSIPPAIFNISSMKSIDFTSNRLSGSIPINICDHLPNLERLYLSINELEGHIPSSLHKCTNLRIASLSTNKFTGGIPREIGNVTMLEGLYLGRNSLKGEIPEEIGNLFNLKILTIQGSELTGLIPFSIFNISSIKYISLTNNSLYGGLPTSMCNHLPLLETFYLTNNKFGGDIPKGIGNCSSLQKLDLGGNLFSGIIPQEIGNLHNLSYLGLSDNGLTSSIPSTIFNISTMQSISFVSNQLVGNLPSNIGISLPNLEKLLIGGNEIGGHIPASISNASKLTILDIGGNLFDGYIPKNLGNLENLELLNLGYNDLTSEPSPLESNFLSSLTNCKHLKILGIQSNPLNGLYVASLGNLSSSLEKIDASYCGIRGAIPPGIGNLSTLVDLWLGGNEFTGSIPETLAGLSKLQRLQLEENNIQGSIPNVLCGLRNLGQLSLSQNNLLGSIPICLGNVTSLRYLLLGSNQFSSAIPSTLWSLRDILVLNLSSNDLSGNIPAEIASLKVITQMDLSRNDFSGNIPSSIGELQYLVTLFLTHNRLEGPIPRSFGSLISLESLDLSYNNLSGEIPKSFEALLSLKYFNVSFNRLQGEIPTEGIFTNFTARSFIGNDGLCGAPQLQVAQCHDNDAQESRAIMFLKYVLPPIVSTILLVAFISLFIRHQRRKKDIPTHIELFDVAQHKRISYRELQSGTDDFAESNLLGAGSFGSVYKGILSDGIAVAVKVFNLRQQGALKSFEVESEIMRKIRHRNLVKVITSCSNPDFKALVLEYMPNGSLEKWLYSHNYFLDILQRLNIMIDVASALEYLHYGYSTPVVHCDLKPTNVLLDEHMVAHVGDFGIAKLLGEDESIAQTRTLATIGYMAPEHGMEGIVSTRGDVYSYGIMLMETFTRKKPTDEIFAGEMSLKHWVSDSLQVSVIEAVDANLIGQGDEYFAAKEQCVSSILALAVDCTRNSPEERITMKFVVTKLKKIRETFLANVGRS